MTASDDLGPRWVAMAAYVVFVAAVTFAVITWAYLPLLDEDPFETPTPTTLAEGKTQ